MQSLSARLCSAALIFLSLAPVIFAQSPADRYSAEPFVLERVDVVYAMNADGTGYMQKTVVAKIQSEASLQQLGIIGMEFAGNSQHVEFHYVRSRRPDGHMTETPLSGVIEQPLPATVQAPFYSDLKVAQVPVQSLQVGDTLEWEGRVVMTKAEAPNQFWDAENFLTEGSVVLEQSVELRAPATTNVTVWTNPALGIKAKESTDGNQKVYRWESQQLKPSVGPEAEAAKEAKKKHVLTADEQLDEERGKLPSVAWTTFPSWAAVGEWYRGLELSRATPDDEIKTKVAELTAGKTTDEEKVKAIYAYVSTQVRYIGVAFGVGRYQPHQAVDVLQNQYGDCKDKATLLTAMLAAAGVQSDAALIGAGIRFNEAVPSPGSFNHLITHLKLNGQDVWLDSTEEVAPYRMMYAALRDREALVVPPTGAPVIEKTPKDPPFEPFQTWTAKGTLGANGVSDSHITITLRGDDEVTLRAAARQLGPGQYGDFAQRIMNGIGYSGTSSHAEFSRPEDTEKPLTINLDYRRDRSDDWSNLRVLAQLAPVPLPLISEKDSPVSAIRLGVPRTESSTAEMKLPPGWSAQLPEAVHEKAPFATFDETYRLANGTLYAERRIVILQPKVAAADWKSYKKFADAISLGSDSYVMLQRGAADKADTSAGDGGKAAGASSSNAEAAELIRQAITALQKMDDSNGAALLERAKKLNPNEPMLWAGYGYLASIRGEMNQALEDFEKELTSNPRTFTLYPAVLQIEARKGDKPGEEKTLTRWATLDPANPAPQMALAGLLVDEKKYSGAVDAAKKAMDLLPEEEREKNERLQLTLGEAQIKSGSLDQGKATLLALLNKTDDTEMTNDAAYELADAKLELALDEEKEREVLDRLTKETQNWTLDEAPLVLRQKSSLLIASWDTMGWILLREGKPQEAKSYIEAAWENGPNPELQQHLDQLNAALGVHTVHPMMPKADVTVTAAAMSGQQMRTIPLGPSNGRHVVAEYKLLLSHGKLERIEPTGTKTVDGAEAMVRSADLTRLFPQGSEAKLVRGAMVNCFGDRCQLVLEP
jgi:tetratricopeptide (TPR) repeat protein